MIKFEGEIKVWLQFWGQLRKINKDPDIDEADKFPTEGTSSTSPGPTSGQLALTLQ